MMAALQSGWFMIPFIRVLCASAALALTACAGQASADPVPAPLNWEVSTLVLETATGPHAFKVEIADDDAERQRGLMYRTAMALDAGMIFDYGEERAVAMWMKNTVLSLDMAFIRADGRVAKVVKGAKPYSLDHIASGEPVRAVLELNAGTADRIGLKSGDLVRASIFGNAP